MATVAGEFAGNYSTQCPVCFRPDPADTYKFDDFVVLRCPDCASSWRSNMYDDAKLSDIYCGDEYEQHPYFDRDREDEVRLSNPRFRHYQAGLNHMEDVTGIGTLLDVGCGSGTVLNLARRRGWDVAGVELSPGLAEGVSSELGVPVHTGTFEATPLSRHSFDAVTFWDIIEHVIDPVSCIRKAKEVVKPGGVVLFCTPDEQSVLARLGKLLYGLGYSYPAYALHPPNHTYFFCRDGFGKLLEASGFEVVKQYSQSAYFEHSPLASNVQKLGIRLVEASSSILDRQYEMVFVARATA